MLVVLPVCHLAAGHKNLATYRHNATHSTRPLHIFSTARTTGSLPCQLSILEHIPLVLFPVLAFIAEILGSQTDVDSLLVPQEKPVF